jgi:hypothetical protein
LIARSNRSSALGNVIHRLVHGEEEADDLSPLGKVLADGIDLKFDVVGDVNVEDRVGWVGAIGCWSTVDGEALEVLTIRRLTVRLRRSRASVVVGARGFWVEVGSRFWRSVGRAAEVVDGAMGCGGIGAVVEEVEKVSMAARGGGCAAAPRALIPRR